jgi:para-nitrobenzyl esterase
MMLTPLGSITACAGGVNDRDPLVAVTSSGRYRGEAVGKVVKFLGVPYAQPPVGALRFQSPRPIRSGTSTELKDATKFGAASLQTLSPSVQWIYTTPENPGEDCLYVNVWTPVDARNAPVMVILHGGAWRTGSPSMPLFDGRLLAEKGIVIVTVGFRLGALGSIAHPDLRDPTTNSQSNWQLQDQMAAVKWVHENAAAFGGDNANVTLVGQSAGGTSAALISQNPLTSNYLSKAILLSPASNAPGRGFDLKDAAAYAELLAARLNTTVRGLRDVPAAALHSAELALNAVPLPSTFTTGRSFKVLPITDGQFCLGDWSRSAWPANKPAMITNTATEGTFFVDLISPIGQVLTGTLPSTDAALQTVVTGLVRGNASVAGQIIQVYRQQAAADGRPTDPGSIWVEIFGDSSLRHVAVRYADKLAREGKPVIYATHAHTLKAPARGVPHCAELPFIFGTYSLDYYKDKVGAGAAEARLSHSIQSSLVSFAKDARATTIDGSTPWPTYSTATKSSVRWGEGDSGDVVIDSIPKLGQLGVWDPVLGTP